MTRKEIVKALRQFIHQFDGRDVGDYFVEDVLEAAADMLEQDAKKTGWISVKERMPSKGEKVLLYIPEREGCKQHGMYLGKVEKVEADPNGEHNFWGLPTPGSNWRIDGWSYFEEPIVTHWMPLPDIEGIEDET